LTESLSNYIHYKIIIRPIHVLFHVKHNKISAAFPTRVLLKLEEVLSYVKRDSLTQTSLFYLDESSNSDT